MKRFDLRSSLGAGAVLVIVGGAGSLAMPAPPAGASITSPPVLTAPADGETLTRFGAVLAWSNPTGATQYHLQVSPSGGDGPGIDVHGGSPATSFTIPEPPTWFGLLPDMTYTWRVRVSDADRAAPLTDPSWGPWAERTFRTPIASSLTTFPLTAGGGETVTTLTPTLQWGDWQRGVFYYEVQLSKDSAFEANPASARAAVYWALVHAGVTRPRSSYAIPETARLEDATTYHWRVRPRVQGDGKPLPWSQSYTFRTDTAGKPGLEIERIDFGLTLEDQTGCGPGEAASSFEAAPTLTGVYAALRYAGEGLIARNLYRDGEPVMASRSEVSGPLGCLRTAIGEPVGGPDAGPPLAPGQYRLEAWHGGRIGLTGSFVVSPPQELAIGPLTLGSGREDPSRCRLSGMGTSFPSSLPTLWVRFNFVGTGSFSAEIYRGTTRIAKTRVFELNPAAVVGCVYDLPYSPAAGFTAGNYRVDLLVNGEVVQSAPFTITP